ncbi:MAG: GGDEF domain-containing protein [Spirochaetes bacterium]|nr:GGDEF domain-containing protein [Spirochaetota bacterium]
MARKSINDMTPVDKNLKAKRDLLRGVSLFATLKGRELGVVAANSEFYSYRKGDVIFSEGRFGDGLYVIRDGEVLITKQRPDNETMTIAQFIAGESFGEMDLLENREMTATARAETDATILVFPARGIRFQDLLSRHPEISARILHELLAFTAGRIRSTNRIISEKSPWVRDLKEQLYRDKLTGLYNRTYLDEEFPRQLPDYGSQSAIIMIKPDNFKSINDRCGHEAGDKALRLIAFSIRSQIRDADVAVRYRGDEFAVILPGTGAEGAARVADQMRLLISRLNFDHITGGPGFSVTVSVGVAAYPLHAPDAKRLVGLCFNRMFGARDSGGDRIVMEGE